jgi:hypothetical protein
MRKKQEYLSAGYQEWRKGYVWKYVTLSSDFFSTNPEFQLSMLCDRVEQLLNEDEKLR